MPLHEVAHQGEPLQSQQPDGHAHTKNAITLRACTTSSEGECRLTGNYNCGVVTALFPSRAGRVLHVVILTSSSTIKTIKIANIKKAYVHMLYIHRAAGTSSSNRQVEQHYH